MGFNVEVNTDSGWRTFYNIQWTFDSEGLKAFTSMGIVEIPVHMINELSVGPANLG